MQTSMVMFVELVNFLALITNETVLDIVMNFLALVVIADFDDFFYESVEIQADSLIQIMTEPTYDEFLVVQTTTSWRAEHIIPENRL